MYIQLTNTVNISHTIKQSLKVVGVPNSTDRHVSCFCTFMVTCINLGYIVLYLVKALGSLGNMRGRILASEC